MLPPTVERIATGRPTGVSFNKPQTRSIPRGSSDRGYFAERNASYPDFLFDFKSPPQFIHTWPARDIVKRFSSGALPWPASHNTVAEIASFMAPFCNSLSLLE